MSPPGLPSVAAALRLASPITWLSGPPRGHTQGRGGPPDTGASGSVGGASPSPGVWEPPSGTYLPTQEQISPRPTHGQHHGSFRKQRQPARETLTDVEEKTPGFPGMVHVAARSCPQLEDNVPPRLSGSRTAMLVTWTATVLVSLPPQARSVGRGMAAANLKAGAGLSPLASAAT